MFRKLLITFAVFIGLGILALALAWKLADWVLGLFSEGSR